MWEIILEPDRPQITIWRIAYWIRKAVFRHSQYVTLHAFPPQQWLHEGASLLRHTILPVLFDLFVEQRWQ